MDDLRDWFVFKLNRWKIEKILKLANSLGIHLNPNMKKKEMIDHLVSNHWNNVVELADEMRSIDNERLRINEAKRILAREYSQITTPSELEEITDKFDLLIYLVAKWKDKYKEIWEEIKFRTQMEKNRSKWWYTFPRENGRDVSDILVRIREIEKEIRDVWNSQDVNRIFVKIKKASENSLMINIHSEYGKKTPKQFKFRFGTSDDVNPESLSEEDFELKPVEHYPIKFLNIFLEVDEDKYLATFDFDPKKESELVSHVLSIITGRSISIDGFERIKPNPIKEVENKIERTVKRNDFVDLVINPKKLDKRKSAAIAKLQKLPLPEEEKNKIKEYIESFEWKGILAENLEGIAKLDQLVKSREFFRSGLVTMKDAIKEIIERARELGKEDIVKIQFKIKKKNVLISLSSKLEQSSLNERELKALELLLGEVDEEE